MSRSSRTIAIGTLTVMLLALFLAFVGVTSAAPRLDPAAVRAAATQAGLVSLATVGIPQVNNLGDFINPGPGPKSAMVTMGKALFWDIQVGSDGVACATCHFAGGADNRGKNQWSPGLKANPPDLVFGNSPIAGIPGYPQFGPNYEVGASDLPIHQFADPGLQDFNHRVILRTTNDVFSSQGVFKANFTGIVPGQANDAGVAVTDPVFNVGGVNVRRVEPRNAPSVINSVFYFDNFWDGRARNQFNGVNPLGPLDPNATILVNLNGVLTATQVSIPNSSLASQAVGPPLSDLEMSFAGRTFPDVGKKLLPARPLAFQNVHPNDSVLGPVAATGPGAKGLTITTYADMVRNIFQTKYWDSTRIISFNPDGSRLIRDPGPGVTGYSQMEANFSLFFGLAIQAYEGTLVSDRTRFDLFMEGDDTALDQDELAGLLTFINTGVQAANPLFAGIAQGSCTSCHKSTTFSDATFTGMGIEGPIELEVAPVLVDGLLKLGTELALLDNGFYNIGVRPINEDLGRGATELGKPLSSSRQALQGFTFAPRIPPAAPQNPRVLVDGAFKVPSLRNVELTAPYFHNGGYLTLRQVMDFYRRNGDFSDVNIAHLDGPMAKVELRPQDVTGRDPDVDRLVKFMLALTDDRVRYEMAPFDHPQLFIPNGHPGDRTTITAPYNVVNGVNQARDILVELPAVGQDGRPPLGLGPLLGLLDRGALQGVNIILSPGWNTFSTPVRLHTSTDTWGEFAAANGLSYQAAYWWNGTAFQFVDPAFVLNPLDAIYVKMNNTATVAVIPYESISAPPSKTLAPGWNLIGSAFLDTAMPVKDALASAFFVPNSVAPNATVPLWGYSQVVSPTTNASNWTYVREALTIPDMQIGRGYWVFMVNGGPLSGFTSTPLLRPR
ncbi:MAG: hypothetical protein HY673_12415 [Chloroflexi bacterium]|nr:hypothetical protein [Chloroflexota bacterium]